MDTSKNKGGWLKDAIIYNILIDRFSVGKAKDEEWSKVSCDGSVFSGGNIKGITDRLDYLLDLGINTILLTPLHTGLSYHGYHITDFYSVDSRFGTFEDVRELVNESHRRNIKIIFDLVVNHVSIQHPFFIDAQNNSESKYRDWFYFKKWPSNYISFLIYKELPKLNLENKEVRDYIIKVALFWQDFGFDGFRIDHVVGVPYLFFEELRRAVDLRGDNIVLIGEALKTGLIYKELETLKIKNKIPLYLLSQLKININILIQKQYVNHFDALIDFSFRDIVKKYLIEKKPQWVITLAFKIYYLLYPKTLSLITMLDNPDKDRLLYVLNNDKEKYKEIISTQFKQDQPAMIFYGSEAGLTQTHNMKSRPYGDLAIRSKMPWHNIDPEIHDYYKKVIKLKQQN